MAKMTKSRTYPTNFLTADANDVLTLDSFNGIYVLIDQNIYLVKTI